MSVVLLKGGQMSVVLLQRWSDVTSVVKGVVICQYCGYRGRVVRCQ